MTGKRVCMAKVMLAVDDVSVWLSAQPPRWADLGTARGSECLHLSFENFQVLKPSLNQDRPVVISGKCGLSSKLCAG